MELSYPEDLREFLHRQADSERTTRQLAGKNRSQMVVGSNHTDELPRRDLGLSSPEAAFSIVSIQRMRQVCSLFAAAHF